MHDVKFNRGEVTFHLYINTLYLESDVQLSMPGSISLVFASSESRLPISVNITDDQILELNEQFQLEISFGQSDPPTGQGLGNIRLTTVEILDNEGMLYNNSCTDTI